MLGILPLGSKFDKREGSLVDRAGHRWSVLRGRWRLQFLQHGGWVRSAVMRDIWLFLLESSLGSCPAEKLNPSRQL